MMTHEKIEILSTSLLETENCVEEFKFISEGLQIGFGWHYLLDLSWAARELEIYPGMLVMDAGAGLGIMQWWLTGHGVDVISVDRGSRYDLPLLFRQHYRVRGWRRNDLAPLVGWRDFFPSHNPKLWREYPAKLNSSFNKLRITRGTSLNTGMVFIYNQDLSRLTDIRDNSIDAIVSISALEHNQPEELKSVVKELMRVIKPRGRLVATLNAAKEEDWLHAPS